MTTMDTATARFDGRSAIAARTGGPVALWGHSYGASCAMGAATLTTGVGRPLLYEPSLGLGYPPRWIETGDR